MDVGALLLIVLLIGIGVALEKMLVENVALAVLLVEKLDAGNDVGPEVILEIPDVSSELLDTVVVLNGADIVADVFEFTDTFDCANNVESTRVLDLVDVTFKGIAVMLESVEILSVNDVLEGNLLAKLDPDGVVGNSVTLDAGVVLDECDVLVTNGTEPDIGNSSVEFGVKETL